MSKDYELIILPCAGKAKKNFEKTVLKQDRESIWGLKGELEEKLRGILKEGKPIVALMGNEMAASILEISYISIIKRCVFNDSDTSQKLWGTSDYNLILYLSPSPPMKIDDNTSKKLTKNLGGGRYRSFYHIKKEVCKI